MDDGKRIIEIDGVKIEVDLRTAKRIDTYRVGDNVKILKKDSDSYEVQPGVIVDFAEFQNLPTIVIAVFKSGGWTYNPSIDFIYYNAMTKEKIDMVPASEEEIKISGDGVIEKFEREIERKEKEAEELRYKLDFFKKHFLRLCEGQPEKEEEKDGAL